jgi:hypothetical protein
MNCAVHADVQAVSFCRNCGKAMCSSCARPVRDVVYCEDCLARVMGHPEPTIAPSGASSDPGYATPVSPLPLPAAPRTQPGLPRPGVAFFLGLFPGLGAVYNGEYNKALIHIVVFAAMIVGLSSDLGDGATVALSLLLAGFILYMAFDAMRTAQARQSGQVPADPLEKWSRNWPVGPVILIGLGVLFLLSNFNWFSFYRISRFWPLVLIAVGILMFRNRLGGREQ